MTARGQCPRGGGGVLVNVFTPPFRKSCIRAWIGTPPKKLYPISPTGSVHVLGNTLPYSIQGIFIFILFKFVMLFLFPVNKHSLTFKGKYGAPAVPCGK